jgi:hypothetical protein
MYAMLGPGRPLFRRVVDLHKLTWGVDGLGGKVVGLSPQTVPVTESVSWALVHDLR